MAAGEATIWASAALASGPWLYWRGFRTLRTRRLIANTPTARIRSMAMGLVEINGRVEPRSLQTAPFSGKPCAYWEVDIASRHRRGWTTIHRNQSGSPFFLSDDTGVALVYPHGSECRIRYGTEETCAGLMLPACYGDYMNEHTSALGRLSRLGMLRFRERRLEEGERVYVLGTATPRASSRVVAGTEELLATGTDDAVASRMRTLDQQVAGVVRRGEHEKTFIISQESEKGLMLTLGAKALLQLFGGPILTLVGLGYWLSVFSSGRRPW
ncbi:MAG TPA: GIDE domain-containing protein [Candidatus Eisenbacteria bacterium]|nr:GIDE domain-containing protein [Candidatus Eisenbacteria bacterium]